MKAIQVLKTGGPEVLTLVDLPVPQPKPNEAIVKIAAAGVNFIDIYFREGRYPSPLPFIDGQEAAGTVTEVGSDVKSLKPGDRVAYTGAMGAYAEYAAVPADRLIRVPDKLSDQQAAAAMLQGMTAHYLIHTTYPLKKGETALIHAAAGGVGLLMVQMAKNIGARVIATVGSAAKAKLAKDANRISKPRPNVSLPEPAFTWSMTAWARQHSMVALTCCVRADIWCCLAEPADPLPRSIPSSCHKKDRCS
jgi:NADPH2:quinone reductase